jgi:hypothetical protein
MIPWVCVDSISVFVATGSNNSCVLLLGDVPCTIRFLLLSTTKLIWILRFDFPFRQLGLLLFSLPLAVVPVSIFLLRSSFFFAPATARAGFLTEFFSGSVEQGATTGHSSGYDSQVQTLLQAMVSAAPLIQPRAQGLGPIIFAADFRLLRVLCLAIWSW